VAKNSKPIASPLAGQIAIQAMLATLAHLFANLFNEPEKVKAEMMDAVSDMIDQSAIPDLTAAGQQEIKNEAKALVGSMINGKEQH
jgi:hypothetical protein